MTRSKKYNPLFRKGGVIFQSPRNLFSVLIERRMSKQFEICALKAMLKIEAAFEIVYIWVAGCSPEWFVTSLVM